MMFSFLYFFLLLISSFIFILVPITTKERSGQGDYKLNDWKHNGLLRESWVRLAKVSCLEKKDITHRLGKLEDQDKNKISQLWQKLYIFTSGT